jgi:type II secretory pathway pseudopilin PulG
MIASSASATTERRRGPARGFTLVEITVVFLIVSLLMASLLYTLSAQSEQRSRADTQRRLDEARELLIAYAMVNGRLPCPASTASNGDEAPVGTGICTDAYTGFLPGAALGFRPVDAAGYALDAWGNRLRYAVSANSTVGGAPDYNFTTPNLLKTNGILVTPSDLLICAAWAADVNTSTSTPSCGSATAVTRQSIVVAVVWSQGKNFSTVGAAGNDEGLNNKHRVPAVLNNHGVFVWHEPRPTGAGGGEYDDMAVWIPVGVLYSRLIAAGVLP